MSQKWINRELAGIIPLDALGNGKRTLLKGWIKTWPDGSKCLDVMKYVEMEDGKQSLFQPIQHIQIPIEIADSFIDMFKEATA